jgi:membrane-bound metal-dependent hydrolase YbcI (DUF457 family)
MCITLWITAYSIINQLRTYKRSEFSPGSLLGLFYYFEGGLCAFSGKTHVGFGVGFGFLLAGVLHQMSMSVAVVDFGFLIIGSLLPDVDHRHSILGRFNLINRSKYCKHRGKCHTILGSLALSLPFFIIGGVRGLLMVFLGAFVHLVADKLYSFGKQRQPFAIRIW